MLRWKVQSQLKLAKLNWPVPDPSTMSRCQRHLCVQLSYRLSKSPLPTTEDPSH
jgi:hypothetical protein